MDLNRIFMKNASPTKVGGQAILEGLMMRGSRAMSIAMRKPDGDIHLTVEPLPQPPAWKKIPILRGVASFISSLVTGTGVLLYSADVLEKLGAESGENAEEPDKFELWLEKKFGKDKAFDAMMYISVVLSLLFVIGFFVLLPTWIVNLAKRAGLENVILLNLIEGVLRICMFVTYILLVRSFYTLHPRCGTSFLMFVMVISLLIFSFLGWPNLAVRLASRLLLIPVIAGLSYELLQFTGRHNNACVKALSMPGIMLQKLTTAEPDLKQLEVAIAAMNAVLPSHGNPDVPVDYWVGTLKQDGSLVKDEAATEEYREKKTKK